MLSSKRIIRAWILVFLIFIALIFLSSNAGKSKSWNPVAGVLIDALAPVQKYIKKSVNLAAELWDKYIDLINTHEENKRLKSEINRLVIENSRNRELISTYKR
ncbi:MAG: hypothetical protein GX846_04880, partial [Deltaproteobacteria bacterium]|nr:hypothetical protein [Deltaproteobacteria bacterium]